MIQITPAPLTQEPTELKALIEKLKEAGFDSIDIDIQEKPFATIDTLPVNEAIEAVKVLDLQGMSIGWDLKMMQPKAAVDAISHLATDLGVKMRVYLYSHAQLGFITNANYLSLQIGLGVYPQVEIETLAGRDKFAEIQIMTIDSQQQGAALDGDLLEKVAALRSLGYQGKISIDGGVNLRSAELVRAYDKEYRIDRVSVGSYFQKAKDAKLAYQKLQLALNL